MINYLDWRREETQEDDSYFLFRVAKIHSFVLQTLLENLSVVRMENPPKEVGRN